MKQTQFAARVLAAAALFTGAAIAQELPAPANAEKSAGQMRHGPPACAEPKIECAMTATPAFDKSGRFWLAFSVGKHVYVASSVDNGKSFAAPVVAATVADGVIDAHGDARPKIVALADGTLLVSYTTRPDKVMIGTIFVARSTDGGRSFSPPQALLTAGGQRFETFVVNRKGRIFAAWLDKTNLLKAKAEGREFFGSGVAAGWSDDGGASFHGKAILMDHACECCRVSAALDRDGAPLFAWRQVLDGDIRDHYVAKLSPDGARLAATRVSEDDWATPSCPHHGPSLSVDAQGRRHIVWFTRGKNRQGLFYAYGRDGKPFSTPEKIGDDTRAPSHPYVLAVKGRVYRVWKEFDGTTTTIPMQLSRDGGGSWSAPRVLAATTDASDHPELIEHRGAAYLSWLTRNDGYRLLPLPRDEKSASAVAR